MKILNTFLTHEKVFLFIIAYNYNYLSDSKLFVPLYLKFPQN